MAMYSYSHELIEMYAIEAEDEYTYIVYYDSEGEMESSFDSDEDLPRSEDYDNVEAIENYDDSISSPTYNPSSPTYGLIFSTMYRSQSSPPYENESTAAVMPMQQDDDDCFIYYVSRGTSP
jgi:hypothetical protein